MTADPYERARRPVARHIRETTEQLAGRPALADSFAHDYQSLTMQGGAPD